jgi:hypothetical protein
LISTQLLASRSSKCSIVGPLPVTIILNKAFMITRFVTPRIVAEVLGRIHSGIEHTQDLDAAIWELWFPLEGVSYSPLRVRDVVRSLMKSNLLVKGIRHIQDFYQSTIDREHPGTATTTTDKRPCIVTKGSNLREICKLPWVDVQRTTTNDLMEIHAVLGIDAICSAIEQNLLQVMSSNSADVSRNYIHVIAHEMCRTGAPCALTFNGLTSSNTSTLKLATFERSLESFVRAACIGHTDHLRGISESVIVGKPVSVGTGGDFELIELAVPVTTPLPPPRSTTCIYPPIPDDVTEDVHLIPMDITYNQRTDNRKRTPTTIITTAPTHKKLKTVDDRPQPRDINPFLNTDHRFVPYDGNPLSLATTDDCPMRSCFVHTDGTAAHH